jgi:hypothetical protein
MCTSFLFVRKGLKRVNKKERSNDNSEAIEMRKRK